MRLDFIIPYKLGPKQGDRARIVTAKDGRQFVHHHPATKVVEAAATLAAMIAQHRPDKPFDGPLRLVITSTAYWRRGEAAWRKAHGTWPRDTGPDFDNLAKQMGDVLESSGFMVNDARIADGRVIKLWGDSPGIRIELETIELPTRKAP